MGATQSVQSTQSISHQPYQQNSSYTNESKIRQIANENIKSSDYACSHNNRPGVSAMDLIEHLGDRQRGSLLRDVVDVIKGKEEFSGIDQKSNTRNIS